MALIFSSTRKRMQRPHTQGKKGKTIFLAEVSTARGGKGDVVSAAHSQNQGINYIGKRHCLSNSLDIQQ